MNTLSRKLGKLCAFHPCVLNKPLEHPPQGSPRQLLPAGLQQKRRLHLILYSCNTVLLFNHSVRAGAHFKYMVYGKENGSSATGGGLNAATIAKNESKLVGYSGVTK